MKIKNKTKYPKNNSSRKHRNFGRQRSMMTELTSRVVDKTLMCMVISDGQCASRDALCREAKGTGWLRPLLHAFRGPREAVRKYLCAGIIDVHQCVGLVLLDLQDKGYVGLSQTPTGHPLSPNLPQK